MFDIVRVAISRSSAVSGAKARLRGRKSTPPEATRCLQHLGSAPPIELDVQRRIAGMVLGANDGSQEHVVRESRRIDLRRRQPGRRDRTTGQGVVDVELNRLGMGT